MELHILYTTSRNNNKSISNKANPDEIAIETYTTIAPSTYLNGCLHPAQNMDACPDIRSFSLMAEPFRRSCSPSNAPTDGLNKGLEIMCTYQYTGHESISQKEIQAIICH
jgi:hypothetical protein